MPVSNRDGRKGRRRALAARLGLPALAASLLFGAGATGARAQTPDSAPRRTAAPPTPAEAADYLAYTSPEDVENFLRRLASISRGLQIDQIGRTEPFELAGEVGTRPLLVAGFGTADAATAAERPRVLVLGAQHGDEQSGKEAALRLIRELAVGELAPLLASVDVRVVPLVNPAGATWGVRRNEQGVDPNRDHLRLRSPEVEAVHRLFAAWRPHVVLDLHELGPSVYDVQVGLPTHPDADPGLVEFGRFYLLPYVANELARRNLTFHEYVTAEPVPPELEETSEAIDGADSLGYYTLAPITANNARNAFALARAVTYLVEVSSSRDIDGLARRTESQYVVVRAFLEVIAAQGAGLARRVDAARARDMREDPVVGSASGARVTLRAERIVDPSHPTLTWRVRSELGPVTVGTTDRWRPLVRPELWIARPAAWILEPGETGLAALLLRHGFSLQKLTAPARLLAGSYPVDPDSLTGDASALLRWERREFSTGSWLVLSGQPADALLSVLIEPYSADGWYAREDTRAGEGRPLYPVHRIQGRLAEIRDLEPVREPAE